ncbi:type-1 restriction enzyme MjaXIP specificity domain protein [Corynebacterium simulans]|nr:restriction endonuclease subunit S [Corynebacterium simulans]AMO91858.1 type-1 restriction enzyme MjaXIP specificity domain protein [Corynebacterium simulans]
MANTAKYDWPMVRLRDVCEVVSGGTPKTSVEEYWGGEIPWVTPADLSKLKGLEISSGERAITQRGVDKSSAVLLPAGSVVLSSRAPIGYVAIAQVPMTTNQGCKSFIPSSEIDARYLAHYLLSQKDALQSLGTGATFKELSKSRAADIRIPLPPLDEQRRIAAILDEVATILRQAGDRTRFFRELIISELKSGIAKSTGCVAIPLGELAEIKTGNSPSRKYPEYFGSEIEWIKSDNLGEFRPTTASEGLTSLGKQQARVVPADSILVTCIAGSLSSIGKCSITDREVAFNQQINAILPNDSFDPNFLYWRLVAEPELVRAAATDGMKNLVSKSKFSGIEVTIPPIAEQRRFSEVAASIALVEQSCLRKVELLQELQESLSTRAFQGEL